MDEVPVIKKSQEMETQQVVESSINTSQEAKPATTLAHSVEMNDHSSSSSNDEQVVVPTNSAASTRVTVVSSSSSEEEEEEDDWGRFGWYRRRQEPEPDPKKLWEDEDKLSLEERRARYHCGKRFTKVEDILNLNEYYAKRRKEDADDEDIAPKYPANEELNAKLSLWHGDITRVEVDAIVNAANESCLGGGGVDGAIHNAAGNMLYQECRTLHGCPTGQTKITRGYKLPAKYVLHTVGPIGEDPELLESCYKTCLELVEKHNIKTVVFCGISTGIFGYPLTKAANIALKTVREWIQTGDNKNKVDKIILCTFLDKEKFCYDRLTPLYFPPVKKNDSNSNSNSNSSEKKEDVSTTENKE